ncbi:FecR family protein [Pedobacter duraquae]|uniref:FecR family protein n=1 Tax=Pedobacter duraquae TaxID=425511 RepID=A0A4R6ILF9_9SPHI|nr:FecR family protein [Pedobacter duraquae]TDO22891.1 FecR family protein [Pedobacter duraquae]
MTREDYILLYEKYRSGDCNLQEIRLLENYKDDFSLTNVVWDSTLGDHEEITARIHAKLTNSITHQKTRKLSWFNFPAAAAAIALITLSAALYFYTQKEPKETPKVNYANTIKPGSNKAILTLDDGSNITLNNSENSILANEGTAIIKNEVGGKLVYQTSGSPAQKDRFNTITIPRGGQYQLQLPDGTQVWLNAESSLRFPVAFNGADRKVELKGEAYFEVAKNKAKPFRVISNGTETEVLGTHFNINAYDQQSTTTLVEGSVRLKKEGKSAILKPGEYGTIDGTSNFSIAKADLEATVAWKNGMFIFHDENIRSIMAKVSRWYDVDVSYTGNTANKDFYGKTSRYKNVDELLKNMELTGTVHFKIEPGATEKGRRIVVMP